MSNAEVTVDGLRNVRPDREAVVGGRMVGYKGGRKRREEVVPPPEFRSYYGLPVLNKPTWEALDIAGYLFLGGLAGTSSTLAAAASFTGRPNLARPLKFGAAGAIGLSLAALVHDLGRPARFYNMLRVFKPTSPMSVGSWILSAYGPAAFAAAAAEVVDLPPSIGTAATIGAAIGGPAVATYTGVLVSNTAVPAWHGGHREMPFVFAASAASAGSGLGLITAPVSESAPVLRVAPVAAVTELVLSRVMRKRMGLAGEAYESGKAGGLMKASEALTGAGAALALGARVAPRGWRRWVSAAAGACLVAGSACTRFGVFHAGVASAEDPRYTVEPQKRRLKGG